MLDFRGFDPKIKFSDLNNLFSAGLAYVPSSYVPSTYVISVECSNGPSSYRNGSQTFLQ